MANAGIIDGGDIMVYINTGTTISPTWTPVAHATEHSISHKSNLRERVTKTTGKWKARKAGINEETITVSALTTYGTYSYFDLLALMEAGTEVELKYSGRPAADVTSGAAEVDEEAGDKYRQGFFLIESIDRNDPKDADSTLSATFQSTGEIETKTL